MFSKILIANRHGEIALRIIRACREMGIQTAVVYSTADKDAAYLKLADQAICIGDAPPAESYLNIPASSPPPKSPMCRRFIRATAFWPRTSHFAEVCRSCKIEFIGPPVHAMAAVGDKVACKKLAKKAKVPTVPGSDGAVDDEKTAMKIAGEIGYPVIIKAAAGGGGRGMRVAHNDVSLRAGLKARPRPRRKTPSRIPRFTSKNTSSSAATSRCRSWPTTTATPFICGSAIAPCSGGIKSSSKNRPAPR
jgi:acetyl-CoA carboxylase biotin carboxylase subunit